jgi:hypothetical protein
MSQRCYPMEKGSVVDEIHTQDIKNYSVLKKDLAV